MAKTKEESLAIINNIDEELNKLYVPKNPIVFNEDPDIAQMEKLLLYYKLVSRGSIRQNTTDDAKEALFADCMKEIRSGSDPVSNFALNLTGEERQYAMEELAGAERLREAALEKTIRYEESVRNGLGKDTAKSEDYVKGLFAPVTDGEGMRFEDISDDAEHSFAQKLRQVQNEIDGVRIPVPENLTDRDATLATLGLFLKDDTMATYFERAMNTPGSSLPRIGSNADSGRYIFFENLLGSDRRDNIHLARFLVPDVRREAADGLKAFAEGEKQPQADAIKNLFDKSIEMMRYISAANTTPFRVTSKFALEAYDRLNSPAYKGLVTFTEEEKRWAEVCRKTEQMKQEEKQLEAALLADCRKNYGKAGKPMDDPAVRARIERFVMLQCNTDLHNRYVSDVDSTIARDRDQDEREQMKFNRDFNTIEQMMLDHPEAFDRYLHHLAAESDIMKKLENVTDWGKFADEINLVDHGVMTDSGTKFPDRFMLDKIPGELRDTLSHVPEGNADFVNTVNSLFCMKQGATFPKNPTEKQVRDTIAEFETLSGTLRERYPNGLWYEKTDTGKDGSVTYDVNLLDEIDYVCDNVSRSLENWLKSAPDRQFRDKLIANDEALTNALNGLKSVKTHEADTILYTDDAGRPVAEKEVRNRLLDGEKLRVQRFLGNDTVGVSNSIKLDTNKGTVKVGPERVAARKVDFSNPTYNMNDTLLSLRHVRETLKNTGLPRFKNSTQYNELTDKLDEVIKAQETMPKNANIRQIGTLTQLYAELEQKREAYVNYKSAELEAGDTRGAVRLATIRSLGSLTKKEYVRDAAGRTYAEQAKMLEQSHASQPAFIKARGLNNMLESKKFLTENEDVAEFAKDFDSIMDFITDRKAQGKDTEYIALGMAQVFPKLLAERKDDAYASKIDKTVSEWNPEREANAESFARECEQAVIKYAGLTPDIKPAAREAAPAAVRDNAPKI